MAWSCFLVRQAPSFPSLSSRAHSGYYPCQCKLSHSTNIRTPVRLLGLSVSVCAAAALFTLIPSPSLSPNLLNSTCHPLPSYAETGTRVESPVSPSATEITYIYDAARVLPPGERRAITSELADVEQTTGYRLIIVTGTPSSPAVKLPSNITSTSSTTTIIFIDPTEGNILHARPSSAVLAHLTDTFWGEWTNRYGNQFYVRDRGGADLASLDAIRVLISCLKQGGVYRVVPGIGADQEVVCAGCASLAGVIAGVASRTGGKKFNAVWLTLFSPLWATLFFSFGIGPVVVREGFRSLSTGLNAGLFLLTSVAAWWWIPIRFRGIEPKEKGPSI